MSDRLATRVFKGLMATQAVAEMRANGAVRTPQHTSEERKDLDLYAPIPEAIRRASLEMQRYYRLLFVFENLLRDFIADTLQEVDGDEWFDKRASSDMKKTVDKRKDNEAKNQWHTGRNEGSIYYLDFSDLALLIVNNWAEFKDYFPNQGWVTSRISEAERSRNVIAHTNVLAREEGIRLEMYLRDWIRQTG